MWILIHIEIQSQYETDFPQRMYIYNYIGKEIGKEIGALENARSFVKTVLQTRLGEIPLDLEQYLNDISALSRLEEIVKLAATANSLEEFKEYLK